MNAQRKDNDGEKDAPQDAMASLVRATADAMETFMKTDWVQDAEKTGLPVNPLMANPATMMAAATAIGLKMTGQWASAFLNVMQEAASATEDTAIEVVEPATAKAPEKAPRKTEAPAEAAGEADDLKLISGIGPKLERVLTMRGIVTFAGLAGLSAAEIDALDTDLGLDGRIVRDDWIGQAKAILAERGAA